MDAAGIKAMKLSATQLTQNQFNSSELVNVIVISKNPLPGMPSGPRSGGWKQQTDLEDDTDKGIGWWARVGMYGDTWEY